MTVVPFDPTKHPRHPAGSPEGGEFARRAMVERIAEGAARRLREDREGDPPVLDNFPAGEFDPDGPVKFWPNRIARGLPIGGGSGGAAWKAWVDPKSGKELAFWFVSDMGAPHHLDMAKALGITPPTYGGDEVLTGPLRVSGYGTSTDMGWMASYFANDLGVNKAELQRMEKVGNNLHKLIMDSVEEIPRRHRKDIKDANIMSITPAMAASGMLDDPRLLKALAKLQRQYEKVYRRAARRAAADFKAASVVTAAGGVLPEEIVKAAALVESFLVLTGVARRQLFREILDALLIIYGLDAEERAAELKAIAEYSKLLEQQVGVQAERLVAGVQDAAANVMIDSLHEGWSIPQTADKLQEKIEGIAPWQATMLARTDLIALANGASQQRAVVVNSPELQFKTWLATPDERTRIDHRHAHGQTVPITQPFTVGGEQLLYPGDPSASDGNVINCVPGWTCVEMPALRAVTRRWYEGDLITVRLASGDEFSATPNHPVLRADGGWTALGEIKEGEDLVRAVGWDARAPDPDRPPATIAEVYRLANVATDAERVGGAPPNFHGDGRHGEVQVVAVNGSLLIDSEAASDEQLKQLGFSLADRARAREGDTLEVTLAAGVEGDFAPPGLIRSSRERLALLVGHATHSQDHRLRGGASLQAQLGEPAHNQRSTNSEIAGDAENALAVVVTLTKVIQVDRGPFRGHVYNLDTGRGWYIGNSLVQANCRCTLIYGKDAFGPPGIKQIVMKDDLAVSAAGFVEAQHPRHPAGSEHGGEFAPKSAHPIGQPYKKTLYHGTLAKFVDSIEKEGIRGEWGLWLTESEKEATSYAQGRFLGGEKGALVRAEVQLDKPFVVDFRGDPYTTGRSEAQRRALAQVGIDPDVEDVKGALVEKGFDGQIVYQEGRDEPDVEVFDPTKVRVLQGESTPIRAAAWDESKHARQPAGTDRGGEFARKGTARGAGLEQEIQRQRAERAKTYGQGRMPDHFPMGIFEPGDSVKFWPNKIGTLHGEPLWKAITDRDGNELAFWFVDKYSRPYHMDMVRALGLPGAFGGASGLLGGSGMDVEYGWGGEAHGPAVIARHRKDIRDAQEIVEGGMAAAAWVEIEPPREEDILGVLTAAGWDPAKHPRHPAGSPEGGEFAPKGFYYGASIARGPNDEPIGYHAFRMERGKGRFYDYEAKAIGDRGSTVAGPVRETLEEATRDAQAAHEQELSENAAGAQVDWSEAEKEFNKWAEGLRPYYDDAAEFERLKTDAWMSYENWVDRELPKLQARLNGAQVPGLMITPQLNPASDGDMDVALDPERAIDSGPDFTVELPAAEGGLPPSFTVWTYPEGANARHANDPDWFEQPEGVQVEEVLDILDTDFFPDGPDSDLAGDYARAVDAARGVPDDPGFVTIYRGMTDAEYDGWVAGNEIPTGKWFAGIPTSQYAQDVSGQPPNLYSFRVPRSMLMQTAEHEFQLKKKGRMRNGVIEPTDAVRAAAWDESKHPRDPGGEGGGQWIHKGTTEADGPEKAAGFASRAEADEELKLRADWPQYDAMSDEELLNVQQRLSSRIHGNSLSGIQGIRELRRESGRGGYTPTPEEEAEWAKVEARYEAVNRHVAARRKAAEFAREGAARAEAESTGKLTIGKDELAEILGKQGDTYRDANYQGEYNPDLFITSDLSGRPIRHYVRLPDGRIGHPDEIHESRARGRIIVVPNFPAPRERARYRSDLLRQSVQAVRASGLEEALTALAGALSAAGFVETDHPRHPAGSERGGEFRPKNGSEVVHAEEPLDTSQPSTGPMQSGRVRSIHDKLVVSDSEIVEPFLEAVRTIDQTMYWPAVPGEPGLRVRLGKSGEANQGAFWRYDDSHKPDKITIAPDAINPISGSTHELAHYLDSLLGQDAWNDPKYVGSESGRDVWFNYSSSDPYGTLAPVLAAIMETDMFRGLKDGMEGAEFQYGGRYFRPGPRHVGYLLKSEELIARSFEQYIAAKNPGSKIARTTRHAFSQETHLFPPEYPGYLKGPDLERVNAAWDRVLEERGLLKKRPTS